MPEGGRVAGIDGVRDESTRQLLVRTDDGASYRANADVRTRLEHQRVTDFRCGGSSLCERHWERGRWRRESDLLHRLSEAPLEE